MKTIALTVKIFTFNTIFILGLVSCKTTTQTTQTGSSNSTEYQLSQQSVDAALWFSTSAEMHYAAIQAYDFATLKLKEALALRANPQKPLAVIMDLDETVLDNSPYMLSQMGKGKTFDKESWMEWTQIGQAKAIPGALDFIAKCEALGIEVFFISNRDIEATQGTYQNLINLGINTTPEKLMLRETSSNKDERRNAVFMNFDVLLLIGDNLRDFSENFSKRIGNYGKEVVDEELINLRRNFVIIPNPMYGEWKKAIYENQKQLTQEQKLEIIDKLLKTDQLSEDSRPDSD